MNVPQVSKKTLNLRGSLLNLATPAVMGILNITPDSFYPGSRHNSTSGEVVQKAGTMLEQGARLLDVGGYSTRPGAADVSPQEELDRVLPVIEALNKAFPTAYLSIDTYRASVAEVAIKSGASLINDVSGGKLDENMFQTVARLGVPYILMHMRGTPQTMTQHTYYDNLVQDIVKELNGSLMELRSLGVADVIVDPGFGFAKTVAQNFELLHRLHYFQWLDVPLLVGVSRKSMIWRSLGGSASEALNGTTVLNTLALEGGADLLRVHDVKEAVETITLWELTRKAV
jgi:dihydropteroate synthase